MMIDEFTAMKLNMLGSDYQSELLKYIDSNNLEIKFGGTLQNLEKSFYNSNF